MADIVTLKALCEELKIDPREARERLRAAFEDAETFPELVKSHKPGSAWRWVKSSEAEKEARRALQKEMRPNSVGDKAK